MNNHDSNEGKKSAMTTLNKDSFFDVCDQQISKVISSNSNSSTNNEISKGILEPSYMESSDNDEDVHEFTVV